MPRYGLRQGEQARQRHLVSEDDTAHAVGSGDLEVLATPRLLAWMEGATCAVVAGGLGEAETSVGTRVSVEHLQPSPVGAQLSVLAEVSHVDGRLVRFQVTAEHDDGAVVAHGEITRVIVDAARFLSRLPGHGG